jgi:PAS domain S-box-containing protein
LSSHRSGDEKKVDDVVLELMKTPSADEFHGVILDSINDGVFTVDREWKITSFNRAAERITGVKRQEALGRPCCEVFRASICEASCALRETLLTGRPVVNKAIYVLGVKGQRIPISISTAVFKDRRGNVIGGVETFRDLSLVEDLRREIEAKDRFADIVGRSAAMRQVFQLLPLLAESESTVLIEGASGTGKELFARAIHSLSRRKERPLVAVNCGALPDTLLESELFGYKAGAFTDARRDKPGRFALAEGGTIFLDEIGDISPAMQTRLLRVLQERVYEPLGSVRPVATDVRVLAATHQDLVGLVQAGKFREDLFYRIHVVRLDLPRLRERREDVPLLIDHFIAKFNRLQGKDVVAVADDVLARLMEYDFPGNVRELENILEHAFVLCRGALIEPAHFPASLRDETRNTRTGLPEGLTLAAMEKLLIRDALRRNQGNRTSAARELGIDASTLFRKIKLLGLRQTSAQKKT